MNKGSRYTKNNGEVEIGDLRQFGSNSTWHCDNYGTISLNQAGFVSMAGATLRQIRLSHTGAGKFGQF